MVTTLTCCDEPGAFFILLRVMFTMDLEEEAIIGRKAGTSVRREDDALSGMASRRALVKDCSGLNMLSVTACRWSIK